MIPRLRPPFDVSDAFVLLRGAFRRGGAARFEAAMRQHTGKAHALAFSHARSGLYALIAAMGWRDKEIVIPAFTCAVIPNAIIASGNRPKLVDVTLRDFNMDCDLLREALTPDTVAVMPTHMYGHPMDMVAFAGAMEARPDVAVIQDCALGLCSQFEGRGTWNAGTAAMFSFSIGKQVSSVEGGIIVTDDKDLFEQMLACRDERFSSPSTYRSIAQSLFFFATWLGIRPLGYGVIDWIANNTPFLRFLTEYYAENEIVLPSTMYEHLPSCLGWLGAAQMEKAAWAVAKRNENTEILRNTLSEFTDFHVPSPHEGVSFSHCAFLVDRRQEFIAYMKSRGINASSDVFDYALPDMAVYRDYADRPCPVSERIARHVVTLPTYPDLSAGQINRIVSAIKGWQSHADLERSK